MVKDKAAELASKKLPVERPRVGPFLALLALAVATEFILPRSKDTEEQEARLETTGACADARGRDASVRNNKRVIRIYSHCAPVVQKNNT
jgi:hypothetical protein